MKKRIIPSILLKSGTSACISQEFSPWRTVGTLAQNLKLHTSRDADELIIINPWSSIDFNLFSSNRITSLTRKIVDIPMTYIGGIESAEDAQACINSGFDRIFITSSALNNVNVIDQISYIIGAQSLGLSIPYVEGSDGNRYLWDYKNKRVTHDSLKNFLIKVKSLEFGEIILHSVSRDGSLIGMDTELINMIEATKFEKPVLMSGGFGEPGHALETLRHEIVKGLVIGSAFSLTEHTPSSIRKICSEKEIAMRCV